jgi:hypothetical protein
MKSIITALILVTSVSVLAEPKIKVLPELMNQVNSYTQDNAIPWYGLYPWQKDFEIKVAANLKDVKYLEETTQGDWHYSLIRINYQIVAVLRGELDERELTFYVERPFPTRESGIMFKELWPFINGRTLIFKLKREAERLKIVSIEREND